MLRKVHRAKVANTRRRFHLCATGAKGWKHSSIIQPSKCITV